jgi:hypothetical protein
LNFLSFRNKMYHDVALLAPTQAGSFLLSEVPGVETFCQVAGLGIFVLSIHDIEKLYKVTKTFKDALNVL